MTRCCISLRGSDVSPSTMFQVSMPLRCLGLSPAVCRLSETMMTRTRKIGGFSLRLRRRVWPCFPDPRLSLSIGVFGRILGAETRRKETKSVGCKMQWAYIHAFRMHRLGSTCIISTSPQDAHRCTECCTSALVSLWSGYGVHPVNALPRGMSSTTSRVQGLYGKRRTARYRYA